MRFFRLIIITAICFGFFNYAHAARLGFTPVSVNVSENAGAQTIQVRLDSPILVSDPEYPQPHLVISLTSDNPGRVSISPSAVTYNTNEWSQYKTFTVTPVDNGVTDGDVVVHVNATVVSGSEYYDGFTTSLSVTVFDDEDVTPPVLTGLKKIKRYTTIEDAVYEYSMSNETYYHCHLGFENSTDEHAVAHAGEGAIDFSGLVVGGRYRATLWCDDHNHNRSNTLDTGSFTIVGGYRNIIGSLPKDESGQAVSIKLETVYPVLRFGQKSPEVKILQQLLNKQGILVSSSGDGSVGLETDYFGMKTLQAVKTFQKLHGLGVDGVVGEKTWELLK